MRVGTVAALIAVVLSSAAVPGTAAASPSRLVGEPGRSSSVERSAETVDIYNDVCGDAGNGVFDLRNVVVGHETVTGQLLFEATTCGTWSDTQLGTGVFSWDLVSNGHVVEITQTSGVFQVEVYDTSGAVEVLTFAGAASRPDNRSVRALIPGVAVGQSEFSFLAELTGPDGNFDRMADTRELVFPINCNAVASQTLVVEADPRRVGETVAAARAAGYGIRRRIDPIGLVELTVPADPPMRAMSALPNVQEIRRPVPVERLAAANDPSVIQQWALDAVDAPAGWDEATTSGLTLAVIDDGIDGTRTDLSGRVLNGRDIRAGTTLPTGANSDLGGHGTAVSGIAAARGNNAKDIAGIDWGAKLIPYRVFDAMGCGTDLDVAEALVDAVSRGADVANLSLGSVVDTASLRNATAFAIAQGVILVAAVGNAQATGNVPSYPAAYPDVIGVGATTRSNAIAFYSNTGAMVDVVAPGGDSSRTNSGDVLSLAEFGTVGPFAGTSFSAPHVAGAVLLYLALNPLADHVEVSAALAATSKDLGTAGRDDTFGWGLLDLAAFLTWEGASGSPAAALEACPDGEVPEDGFTDFPNGAIHEDAVDCIVWWKVASGVGGGLYAPANTVSRAQMARFVFNAINATGAPLDSSVDHFTDDGGSVHEEAINALATAGVVSGVGGGRYAPGSQVSRAQMAKFLVEAYEYVTGEDLTTTQDFFNDDESSALEGFINAAAAKGFASGVGGSRYDPDGKVTRAQMGTFLKNLLQGFVDAEAATPPNSAQ